MFTWVLRIWTLLFTLIWQALYTWSQFPSLLLPSCHASGTLRVKANILNNAWYHTYPRVHWTTDLLSNSPLLYTPWLLSHYQGKMEEASILKGIPSQRQRQVTTRGEENYWASGDLNCNLRTSYKLLLPWSIKLAAQTSLLGGGVFKSSPIRCFLPVVERFRGCSDCYTSMK